jgi:hypothetical protein
MIIKDIVSPAKLSGCLTKCRQSRKLVLVIVFIALFLDNMLLTTVGTNTHADINKKQKPARVRFPKTDQVLTWGRGMLSRKGDIMHLCNNFIAMLYEIFFFNLIWYCNASFKKIHTNHSKVL